MKERRQSVLNTIKSKLSSKPKISPQTNVSTQIFYLYLILHIQLSVKIIYTSNLLILL